MPTHFQETNSGLYTSESLLKVIDALPVSITVIDKNCTVLLANQAASLFFGKEKSQLVGQIGGNAFGCIHHEDSPDGCGFGANCSKCILRQTVMSTITQKKGRPMTEASMVFKRFGKKHLRIFTLPIILDEEEVILLALEDITENKRHEQVQLEKEKLATVMKTVGAVCHEINQPLMIVLGLTEIMMEDLPEDHIQSENLRQIKEQVERLGTITKKLSTITKYRTKPYLKGEIIDLDLASDTSA